MKNILIVDDFSSVRIYHRALIRNMGYAAFEAKSVDEALQTLSQQPIDLVILDLLMPGKDGQSLLEQLERSQRKPAVIVVTSESERYGATYVKHLPVCQVLSKPTSPEALKMAIAASLGGRN